MYAYAHTPLNGDNQQSNLQVSHLVTNSLLSYEAFMVLKDFLLFLPNKCRPSLKPLQNKVLLLFTSMIVYLYQTLKNICFNL